MDQATTMFELIGAGGDGAAAIFAPGRPTLDYRGLRAQAKACMAALNRRGVGRGDRVAIVLPNGPEMATAFVSVACAVATAPLNPAYRQDEFSFYMKDIGAKLLIVEQGSPSPVVAAAHGLAISVIEIAAPGPRGFIDLYVRDQLSRRYIR